MNINIIIIIIINTVITYRSIINIILIIINLSHPLENIITSDKEVMFW